MTNGIGQRIREKRIAKGWTQQQLEDETGIAFSTLSNYETGLKEPGIFNLNEIANALGTTIDYLYNGDDVDKLVATKNKGLLIATAIRILQENEIIFVDDSMGLYKQEKSIIFQHSNLIIEYIKNLEQIERDAEDYKNPGSVKDQITEALASKLNK